MITAYFTNASGPGPVRYGQLPGSIGVLEAIDKPMPIGIASEVGWTDDGLAVWWLRVHGADILGRWVIIDRRFVPVDQCPAMNHSGPGGNRPVASGDG